MQCRNIERCRLDAVHVARVIVTCLQHSVDVDPLQFSNLVGHSDDHPRVAELHLRLGDLQQTRENTVMERWEKDVVDGENGARTG